MAEALTTELMQQDGYWLPAYDAADAARLIPYLRKMAKDAVMSSALAKRHRVCVQAGGHVGIWPLCLSWLFEQVITFEPQPAAYAALLRNTATTTNITAHSAALGAKAGWTGMKPGPDSGTWRTEPGDQFRVVALDDLKLPECDVIYLDVEGSEAGVLMGARETIRRCRPVLHVEMLPRSTEEIKWALHDLGYRFVSSVHKDSIYVAK